MGSIVGSQVGGPPGVVTGDLDVTGTLTANALVGPLSGNVSGNVTGSISGGTVSGSTVTATTNGTAAAPSISVNGQGGLYSAGASQVNVAAGGSAVAAHVAGTLTVSGSLSATASVIDVFRSDTATALQTLTAVGDAITFTGTNKRLAASSSLVLTSTPTIAIAGTSGYEIEITYEGANTVTLTDEAGLAGSLLELGAATRALVAGTKIRLRSDGTKWREQWFSVT